MRGTVEVRLPEAGGTEVLIDEVPVALVFDGVTQAVMMASPLDLHDFQRGFAYSEGLITATEDLRDVDCLELPEGIEVRGWLAPGAGEAFRARRRAMAGPVGCGLCGIDSLREARRALPAPAAVAGPPVTPDDAPAALDALRDVQHLQDLTRSCHAAGLWSPAQGLLMMREDVGRHNALDKLIGAGLAAGLDPAQFAIVMTSRLSVDLVQKAAVWGAKCLIAPSAPTALAVSEAECAGLQIVARARSTSTGFAFYCTSYDTPA
ncbi:formate dehydrogenase accessory sulfurtransferase FdhD [Rhodobacteraceae bacterium]|nr:formate dehydrogenase accessory sulfurtransferase FdhD [Paracoccaceae bacterium]